MRRWVADVTETTPVALKWHTRKTNLANDGVTGVLLINGVQAAGRGGVVTVRASDNAAGAAEIEVCDSGPGIAPDAMNRIFNPFFTTKASGTGLGLAIVHRIVEAHGGTIAASNREEGGARFVVTIPPRNGPIHGRVGPMLQVSREQG